MNAPHRMTRIFTLNPLCVKGQCPLPMHLFVLASILTSLSHIPMAQPQPHKPTVHISGSEALVWNVDGVYSCEITQVHSPGTSSILTLCLLFPLFAPSRCAVSATNTEDHWLSGRVTTEESDAEHFSGVAPAADARGDLRS